MDGKSCPSQVVMGIQLGAHNRMILGRYNKQVSQLESDVFLNGGRIGGKGLETAFFAINKPVQFSSSRFLLAPSFF